MNNQTTKNFDCLAFKTKVQNDAHKSLKGLSAEQRVAFYHREAINGPLGDWLVKKMNVLSKKKVKANT